MRVSHTTFHTCLVTLLPVTHAPIMRGDVTHKLLLTRFASTLLCVARHTRTLERCHEFPSAVLRVLRRVR